jgi:hypothetical protein
VGEWSFLRKRRGALKTHGKPIAHHDDTFLVTIAASVDEQTAGVHIAEVQFIGEIVEEFVNHPEVGFPTGFIVVVERIGNPVVSGYTKRTLQGNFTGGVKSG